MKYIEINPGVWGENIANNYLKENGYKIISRNEKFRFGELDIIASKDNQILFVEVKTRMSQKYGLAAEFVNYSKQRKLILSAQEFIKKNNLWFYDFSFDIIEVYYSVDNWGGYHTEKIEHISNAFEL